MTRTPGHPILVVTSIDDVTADLVIIALGTVMSRSYGSTRPTSAATSSPSPPNSAGTERGGRADC